MWTDQSVGNKIIPFHSNATIICFVFKFLQHIWRLSLPLNFFLLMSLKHQIYVYFNYPCLFRAEVCAIEILNRIETESNRLI